MEKKSIIKDCLRLEGGIQVVVPRGLRLERTYNTFTIEEDYYEFVLDPKRGLHLIHRLGDGIYEYFDWELEINAHLIPSLGKFLLYYIGSHIPKSHTRI